MGKAGFTNINHWISLISGRSSADNISHRRYVRIFQGLITAIAGKGMSVVVSLVSAALTVRYLGAERYGIWMTISTLLAWLSLADIGLGNSLTNALSEAYAADRRDIAQTHTASVFWMLWLVAAGLAGICFAVWPWMDWNSLLNVKSALGRAEIGPAIAVTLAIFLLNFPLSIIARVLGAYQESAYANFWAAGANITSLGGIILATHLKLGLVPLIAAFSGSSLIITALSGIWLFGFHKPWLRPSISAVCMGSIRSLTTVGSMFFIVQIAALMILQTDNLIIAHYLGVQAVTPYSVTWRLFNCSTLIQALLLQSLWPAYAEAFARKDGSWIRRTFRLNLWSCVLITFLMVVPMIIFGRGIIRHWVGAEAVPSMTLLVLMGIWSIIGGAFQSIVCMLNGIGRVKIQMIVGIITATANIALSIWLVRIYGVEGVILGTLISYFVLALIPVGIETKNALASLPDAEPALSAAASFGGTAGPVKQSLLKSLVKQAIPRPVRKAARFMVDSINAAITLSVRTHKRRWEKVSKDPHPHWDGRNLVISSLIPDGSSVLDLGCGAQTLRRHLKPGCRYQPCDVIKSSPDVILCDFNAGIYPEAAGDFDYVVCSGVFEYIRNPMEFLRRISLLGHGVILSYNPLVPGKSKFSRLAVNWNNHLTKEETENLFDAVPLIWNILHIKEEDGETIYSLHIDKQARPRPDVLTSPAGKGAQA